MGNIPHWNDVHADWVADHIGAPRGLTLRQSPVGQGQVAECRRLELLENDTVVASVIAKGPSHDPTSAATAAAQRLYLRETSFYSELASQIATPTPTCFYSEIDHDDSFLILLDDLAPAAPVDQFQGLSFEYVERGLRALAGLHAPTANQSSLFDKDWLGGTKAALAPLYQAILPGLFDSFLLRYVDLEEPVTTLVRAFAERLTRFSNQSPVSQSVVHGDFRSDNLLFDARGGEVPLAVVDWQTVSVSSPYLDVAYFLVTSVDSETLIQRRDDFLNIYLSERESLGSPLREDNAKQELARYALQPVAMLVPAAVIVERTERGDRMFIEMLRRAAEVCREWDSLGELDRHVAA